MKVKENTENPYLAIAEAELNKEVVWYKGNDEKIAEAIMDQRSEIVNSICDEIQTDLRIQELIREDVFEVIHDYLGNRYKLY